MVYLGMRKIMPKGIQKKECSKCDKPLEDSRVGKYRYCKVCHAEWMRKYRPKHTELKDEARKKANCRSHTKEYVKRGNIKKFPCIVCGSDNSEAHHEDYSKPKEVVWYCRKHHLEYHESKKLIIVHNGNG